MKSILILYIFIYYYQIFTYITNNRPNIYLFTNLNDSIWCLSIPWIDPTQTHPHTNTNTHTHTLYLALSFLSCPIMAKTFLVLFTSIYLYANTFRWYLLDLFFFFDWIYYLGFIMITKQFIHKHKHSYNDEDNNNKHIYLLFFNFFLFIHPIYSLSHI